MGVVFIPQKEDESLNKFFSKREKRYLRKVSDVEAMKWIESIHG